MDFICSGGLSVCFNQLFCECTGYKGQAANPEEEKAARSKIQDPEKIHDPRSSLARFRNVFGTVDSMRWSITKSFFTDIFWDLDFEIFLGFGIWDLDLPWILDLGSWCFGVVHHTNTSLMTSPCTSVN